MTSTPLLSIITVTYRDVEGVVRTLGSLAPLFAGDMRAVEVIVIDGGSGSDLHSALEGFTGLVRYVSEPDNGTYDAMNKGLGISTGKFVWFLNGGDESDVQDWASLLTILRSSDERLLLGAYKLDTGRSRLTRRSRTGAYIWHGLPTSHQAIFFPGEATRAAKYDLSYKICGDYELTARLMVQGIPVSNIQETVAVFHAGGMSQHHARGVAREAARVQKNILQLGLMRRLLSQLRHLASRNLRRLQTRGLVSS